MSMTCYWKKLLVNHSSILRNYVNQKLAYHLGFGQSNAAMYMIIAYTVGLYYLKKSVRCRWRLVPCYAKAGHIYIPEYGF